MYITGFALHTTTENFGFMLDVLGLKVAKTG